MRNALLSFALAELRSMKMRNMSRRILTNSFVGAAVIFCLTVVGLCRDLLFRRTIFKFETALQLVRPPVDENDRELS